MGGCRTTYVRHRWSVDLDTSSRLAIGRIVGPAAMKFGGWQRLNAEYAKQFGIARP